MRGEQKLFQGLAATLDSGFSAENLLKIADNVSQFGQDYRHPAAALVLQTVCFAVARNWEGPVTREESELIRGRFEEPIRALLAALLNDKDVGEAADRVASLVIP